MKTLLYGNGGCGNHGCEAIVRGTAEILGERLALHSIAPDEDYKYGLDRIADLETAIEDKRRGLSFLKAYVKLKLTGNFTDMDGLAYLPAIQRAKGKYKIALSVGGDNYCYDNTGIYDYLNRAYNKAGMKTVLWGCSVEPKVVEKSEVAKDLARYQLVVARESITYEAIKAVNPNTILAPDPAFFMKSKECEIDQRVLDGNVVGINISPMIVSNETSDGITLENYRQLIQYILEVTNLNIALIPHVVWKSNDDRSVLMQLYQEFGQNDRIVLVEDHTAPELKYIISKCKMFVGARTHATIAAYSSGIPTLVVGYSVKARGIARDLFGTEKNYVIPVQSLKNPKDLTDGFKWLSENQIQIRKHLKDILPEYIKNGDAAKKRIKSLV